MRGRYILESVVSAHEVVHAVHSTGRQGLVFKIDYEKAYDKVNLNFLYEMLALRGFGSKWIGWIKSITQGGSVGVKLNGEESDFFLTGKGLRQGDPLSPYLFLLCTEGLTALLANAEENGNISGVKVCRDAPSSQTFSSPMIL